MDGNAENGNSVAGHSHFQPLTETTTTTTTTTTTAAVAATTAIMNGASNVSACGPHTNSSTATNNSVTALTDSMTQPQSDAIEVGSTQQSPPPPQPLARKTVMEMNGKQLKTNQFHSRHDSEQITINNSNSNTSNGNINNISTNINGNISKNNETKVSVNSRKQQLEQITSGKCTATTTKHSLNQSVDSATKTTITNRQLQAKFLQINGGEKNTTLPSKRNSLALLADQKLEEELKKSEINSVSATSATTAAAGAAAATTGDKMVAMQELATATTFDDNSEELQYGPGIVSKLRCRYLSLALRQTVKQRPTLDNLRRANSMSNLLEEENVDIDEVDDRNVSNDDSENILCQENNSTLNGSHDKSIIHVEYNSTQMYNNNCSNGNGNGNIEQGNIDHGNNKSKAIDSRRQIQRGNDSLKRARSVEALMRYDTLAWRRDVLEDSEDYPSSNPIILDEIIVSDYQSTVIKAKTADSITIEDKIQQARDRMNDPKPPRRLTSFMSDTERPPPDLVKQTLLKFEASANKRNRTIQRYGNGDVAAKVATYKSKMSQDKPVIAVATQITSKLPPSGFGAKKPLIKPRTTSPKPVAFLNGTTKDTLAKKAIYTKTHEHDGSNGEQQQQHTNGNGLKSNGDVERRNQKNASPQNFNGMRIDTSSYRNKYDQISSPESPLSSSPFSDSPRPSYVYDMVRRRETNHSDSPLITQLARKTESMILTTPKIRKMTVADVAFNTDDSSVQPSDNDDFDDVTSNSSENGGWSESYDVNISDNDDSENDDNIMVKKSQQQQQQQQQNVTNKIKATVISVQPSMIGTNGSNGDKQPEPSVRQIGIIRPLNHDAKPPVPIARKLPSTPTSPSSNQQLIGKDSPDSIKVSVAAAPIVVSTQHSVVLPSTTSSVVVTNSVSVATTNDVQGDVVVIECSGDSNIDGKPMSPLSTPPTTIPHNNRTKLIQNTDTNKISIDTRSIVHQKNLLNKEKSEECMNGNIQSIIQSPIKWNIKKSTVVSSSPMSTPPTTGNSATATAAAAQKQRPNDISTTNTMVFNFSNRKDVPDYIENDGLVIRRKRELPKPGESGFVLLGDLTVETSTDPEPDDSWICDPPSPCDVHFKNANVVINGKSSLRDRSKTDPKQLSIRFNEVLTSTFEYPSESSLCEDIGLSNSDSFDDDETDLLYSNGHFLGSSPIASVPLGNYQPIKIFNTNFELGVTRTHTSSPNTSHKNQTPPPPPPRTHSNGKVPKPVSSPTAISPSDNHQQQLISIDNSMATSNGGEPESLQFLKPANEDAVAWSEGASDLLF